TPHAKTAVEKWIAFIQHYRYLAETENAYYVLEKMLEEIAYKRYLIDNNEEKQGEMRWQNVVDFIEWIKKKSHEKNLFAITQNIALLNILDNQTQEEMDAVHLTTLHSAKGLEYPFVFLAGCEEGLFPHQDSIDENNLHEERRLMYVGITRAMRLLTVTYAIKRKRAGHWQFNEPSRFIDEMPLDDIQILGRKNTAPIISREEGNARLTAIRQQLLQKSQGK
ncbi:MAG: ATP-binding domain-containing protein, partial [Neisseriaceae bacterium]|nr:ATP-binding domain-containing protein [Neisseriaceae bacterium]